MPKFNDQSAPVLIPDGDYIFCCTDFECGISNTGKTNGADKFELSLEIEGQGRTLHDVLFDHESIGWRLDTFIKSVGVKIAKGQAYEFRKDKAERSGVQWVNPIGLRGWCRVIVEGYTDKGGQKKSANKIGTYYVDKEKLSRREIAEEEKPF